MTFFASDEKHKFSRKRAEGVDIPYAVNVSNQKVTLMHSLGRLPRAIYIALCDKFCSVRVDTRTKDKIIVVFDAAPCNVVLRVE